MKFKIGDVVQLSAKCGPSYLGLRAATPYTVSEVRSSVWGDELVLLKGRHVSLPSTLLELYKPVKVGFFKRVFGLK